jgi:glycosyltransferase involved in cell wall biosynthesis
LIGGGAEKQLLITAAGLAERGHSCSIYCLSTIVTHARYEGLVNRCIEAGVKVVSPDHWKGSISVLVNLTGIILRKSDSILWAWGFRAEMVRVMWPVFWLPKGVVALRSASFQEARTRSWLLTLSQPITWRYLANSRRGLEVFSAIPGVLRKGRVVYNALEPSLTTHRHPALARSNGITHVHMLGNIFWHTKGYDIAIELAEQIKAANLPVRIYIGGNLPEGEKNPAEQIDARGLSGIIYWKGLITSPVEFLSEADVFLLLSRHEGTPNALLEAMALGIPCIATDVGDLGLFVKKGAALDIIPSGDAHAAFQAILRLQNDSAGMHQRGQINRNFCSENFSENRMLDETENALSITRAH